MPESPLFEAHRIVHADRGADYGPPVEDFERTGKMWGAILGTAPVTPQQVALCMIALKVSREAYHHKRDSLVDVAGYVETLAMIEGESSTELVKAPDPEFRCDCSRTGWSRDVHATDCALIRYAAPLRS